MKNEFIKFQEYLERVNRNLVNALRAFCAYEALIEARAPNKVGQKEAEDNTATINRYIDFFSITERALYFYSLMELAKILDNDNNSLSLNKLINFAKTNKKKLNVAEFKKYNPDRQGLEELAIRYEGISGEDFKGIERKLEESKKIWRKIKTYRDKFLAHDDLIKPEIKIFFGEIHSVFDTLKEIINTFSYKTNFSTTGYGYPVRTCKDITGSLIECLKKGELYYLKEFDEE